MPEAVILLTVLATTALTMLLLSPMAFGWSTLLALMSGVLRRAEARR
jgi:hypothetical protein